MSKGSSQVKEEGGILNGLFSEPPGQSKSGNPFGSATPVSLSAQKLISDAKKLANQEKELVKYKEVQHLQLVKLQNLILDAITEEKLEAASLTDLVRSFSVLKEKEHLMTGKATQITGIVGYLLALEKEEAGKEVLVVNPEEIILSENDFEVSTFDEAEEQEEELPRL